MCSACSFQATTKCAWTSANCKRSNFPSTEPPPGRRWRLAVAQGRQRRTGGGRLGTGSYQLGPVRHFLAGSTARGWQDETP
jgi:hypothetical protein